MLNSRIILKGLDPASMEHNEIHHCLSILLEEAPSDASIKFSLLDGQKGLLKIYSSQKQFFAEKMNHSTALELVHDLVGDVRVQLMEWKSQRFKVS